MIRYLRDLVAATMTLTALGVIAWLASNGHEAATGALIAVVSTGTGWYLRGRIGEAKE